MNPQGKREIPEEDELRGQNSADFSGVRGVTNEMLAERIDGLRGMLRQATLERDLHVAEDRAAHAEFRAAIANLATQASVTRSEFKPVQMLVYSMVGTIMLAVLGALVTLVVRS